MTEKWDGFGGPLVVGDMVRVVSSVMIDEVGVVGSVEHVVESGQAQHRITKAIVDIAETMYSLDATDKVLFTRKSLYKLPPDFFTVTNLEAAQRIRKLLLTHTED